MTRSLTRLQALVLGAVVLLALALAAVGVFAVGNRLWSPSFHVTVGFKQIRGVEVGTPVRVQGIDAGEVVGLEAPMTPGGDVRVRMRLDAKLRSLVRADATAQIVSEGMLGGRAIEIDPGSQAADVVADGGVIASRPTLELSDAVNQMGKVLQSLEGEKGRLIDVVDNTNKLLRKGTDTFESIHNVAEGIKRVPLFRNYVEDPNELTFRPNAERNRQWFASEDLFESGRAVLTTRGQERLKGVVPWVLGLTQHDGAEVVVLAFADPKTMDAAVAKTLTQQQTETVGTFLKDNNAVYKRFGLVPRKLVTRGLGTGPPPVPEKESLPPARVEVLVFVPQK